MYGLYVTASIAVLNNTCFKTSSEPILIAGNGNAHDHYNYLHNFSVLLLL